MSSFRLSPSPALVRQAAATAGQAGAAGVTVAERAVSICSVIGRQGADALLADRVRAEFGIELPKTPRSGSGGTAFIWAGPNQWLALRDGNDSRAFEQHLRDALAGAASVTDQSDGRTVLRVSGPRARDALAKGVTVDLHPAAFRPGDTAVTVVAYINVHLWQVDDTPTYDIAMFRSFAVAFRDWLSDAAAEFGVSAER